MRRAPASLSRGVPCRRRIARMTESDAVSTALPADSPTSLTLTRPDDWHLHLRDGAVLPDVVPPARASSAAPSSCPTCARR